MADDEHVSIFKAEELVQEAIRGLRSRPVKTTESTSTLQLYRVLLGLIQAISRLERAEEMTANRMGAILKAVKVDRF